MSTFIVSKDLIDALVTGWINLAKPPYDTPAARRTRADQVGAMLWAENHKSVECLYKGRNGTPADMPAYAYNPVPFPHVSEPRPIAPAVLARLAKLLDCYVYQSCEHPGWKESEARRFCMDLRDDITSALPGYDDAPWGNGGRDVFVAAPAARGLMRGARS